MRAAEGFTLFGPARGLGDHLLQGGQGALRAGRPLINIEGVAVTSAAWASILSLASCAWVSRLARSALNFSMFSPSLSAVSSMVFGAQVVT